MLSFYLYCSLLAVFIMGLDLVLKYFKSKGQRYIRFRKRLIRQTPRRNRNKLYKDPVSQKFYEAGLKLNVHDYKTFRYLFVIACMTLELGSLVSKHEIEVRELLLLTLLFIMTTPIERVGKYWTPFGKILSLLVANRKVRIDREHLNAMTQLKNLCIAQEENRVGGDYLIEQLFKNSDVTKPAYTKLLGYWRMGQTRAGCEAFGQMLDTKISRELANIFEKIDALDHRAVIDQIIIYQSFIREERMTRHEKRQEILSYILYAPVVASAFMIILNFMVIVIWLDTMDMIQNI